MNRIAAPLIILVALVLIIVGGTFYQVDETEQVIVTQFGEPVRGPITTPGLKMKVPFIQTIRRFDKRVLEWDGLPGQIPTLDKRFIVVDTTARWRIWAAMENGRLERLPLFLDARAALGPTE